MKFSAAFVFTLLTGALAAPQAVTSESDKRDVAARDFSDSLAHAVDPRHVDAAVTLDERDVAGGAADEEDDELEARAAKKKAKKAKGKKKAAKGKKKAAKGKKKAAKGKKKAAKAANANDAAAASEAAAKPRVTSSFDAPGVV